MAASSPRAASSVSRRSDAVRARAVKNSRRLTSDCCGASAIDRLVSGRDQGKISREMNTGKVRVHACTAWTLDAFLDNQGRELGVHLTMVTDEQLCLLRS